MPTKANINPAALDQYGFKGSGLYNFTHPGTPFGDRTMWASRAADGAIEIADGEGGPVVARVTDDEFRAARDWPVPLGDCHVLIGAACVSIAEPRATPSAVA